MNSTAPRFLRLRTKLAISFALLTVLTVGITTYIYYRSTRAQLRQDISERLQDAVAIGALQVDGQSHAELTEPAQEGNPTYLQIKNTLQGIRDAGTDIRFVYTMRQDTAGNIIFVVDAEESEEDISHLGDVYGDAGPLLVTNFSTMTEPKVEEDFYTDEWGTWLTGYAPFYSEDGQREGILGMDISADIVIAREQQALLQALIIFLLSIPPVAATGWLLGSALTAPISKLTEGARKLTNGDFSYRVRINTRDEIETLAEVFNSIAEKLSGLVTGLEQRVDERTEDLSRRTSQLQAAAQIARQSAAIKDPTVLLNNAVHLISDQFGFHHAGLFLLDENHEYAVLQAASSKGGQRMLARGHRLRVGSQGIVGFVAAQKRPRIALDTGADAVYFNNPDLPETRSEAALPLIIREHVIGVLDIQSDKPQAFTQEDIDTFQTLADQLALAIENARLFEDMEAAVNQLEQSAAHSTRQAWGRLSQNKAPIYQYTPLGVQNIAERSAQGEDSETLQFPIQLHNEKIGTIKVKRKDQQANLSLREQAMLQEISTQVGLALENARLLEEAQQRAARERTISEITAHIGSAYDVDTILRVTAQEIGKALGDSEVAVEISGKELERQ